MGWSAFRPPGLTHGDERCCGGYTLLTPIGGDCVFLIDEEGKIVHYWQPETLTPGYGFLLPGGRLLVRGQPKVDKEVGIGEAAGGTDLLMELDWDGNELWSWDHKTFHHDMTVMPNGNIVVPTWTVIPDEIADKVQGGLDQDEIDYIHSHPEHLKLILRGIGVGGRPRDLKGLMGDRIIEVSRQGEIVNEWLSWTPFNTEKDIICPREFLGEWTHTNSIEYTDDGCLLLSFREISTVLKISWPEGEVVWRFGPPAISHQHDPSITPEGNILIFDNGVHHPVTAHTRVIEVDPNTNEIVWQYLPEVVYQLYSGHVGGAQRLVNGNTLICEGETGRLLEVTRDGDVCWEWCSPFRYKWKGVVSAMIFKTHRYMADSPELKDMSFGKEGCDTFNQEWKLVK